MKFDAGSAFSDAWDRITTQVALVLIGLYAATNVVQTAATQDITREAIHELREIVREEGTTEEYQDFVDATDPALNELPLALGLDLGPAFALLLVAIVAATVVVALAIDAFARRATSAGDLEFSRLAVHTINIFVGGIVYVVLVALGSILVIPGLVLFVVLVFYPMAIVVEDENFVSAFGSSFSTVRENIGHTLLLLLLAFVVGVAGGVLSMVVTTALSGAVGAVIATTVTAAATLLILAMLTRAYVEANPDAVGAVADEPVTEEF